MTESYNLLTVCWDTLNYSVLHWFSWAAGHWFSRKSWCYLTRIAHGRNASLPRRSRRREQGWRKGGRTKKIPEVVPKLLSKNQARRQGLGCTHPVVGHNSLWSHAAFCSVSLLGVIACPSGLMASLLLLRVIFFSVQRFWRNYEGFVAVNYQNVSIAWNWRYVIEAWMWLVGVFQRVTPTVVTDLGYPVYKSCGNPDLEIPSVVRNKYVMCLDLVWRRSYLSQKETLRVEVLSLFHPPHPDLGMLMRLGFSDRNSYLDWSTQFGNRVWKPG